MKKIRKKTKIELVWAISMIDARKTIGVRRTAKVRIVKMKPTTLTEKRRFSEDAALYAVTV